MFNVCLINLYGWNHKNDHLLCGILCTRALIIDAIKALLDSWWHSERNWNSSSPVPFRKKERKKKYPLERKKEKSTIFSVFVLVVCLKQLKPQIMSEDLKAKSRGKQKTNQCLKEMWLHTGLWLIATKETIKGNTECTLASQWEVCQNTKLSEWTR